jgi:hypothetical protein
MLRVGDVFRVEKTYGNGITREERWRIEGKNKRGSALLSVSYQKDGTTVQLKRQETVSQRDLLFWADRGRRAELGKGQTL